MTREPNQAGKAESASQAATTLLDVLSRWAGARWTAMAVTASMIVYLIIGAAVGFDHWWQVFVHSAAAMVTVPMLFVLQHTTNRETSAVLIKLDELIQATTHAKEDFVDLEDQEVSDQEQLHDELHHRT
ncbi:low affinity iron permease family protein [Mycolicibacterium neworleansense]|uniref:Low affinity iron permease n=1 Tax=Mycolicibacterium neworleansense TaxID=146018 RepID=A0A0H5RQD4_9MYCO|nr:low affinity iron permease family protein [Mycolicibacterium neworleansense]MCV7364898.1 low affinity iron permease family protein [Mycolicibacterium neworleansense]CRZ15692.1 Low affinity iron permease [Mycolicibacterium neworleansense]